MDYLEFLFLYDEIFLFFLIIEHIESKNNPSCTKRHGVLLYEEFLPLNVVLKVDAPDHRKGIIEKGKRFHEQNSSQSIEYQDQEPG